MNLGMVAFAVGVIFLFVVFSPQFSTGNFVKVYEDENTKYSYHGRVPHVACGSSDCPHPFLYEQGIDFHGEVSGFFPSEKYIAVGDDVYRFVTTEVNPLYEGTSKPRFDVSVYRDGQLIDSFHGESLNIKRDYGNLEVTFANDYIPKRPSSRITNNTFLISLFKSITKRF